jgi:heterodisulfide reductase subunit E
MTDGLLIFGKTIWNMLFIDWRIMAISAVVAVIVFLLGIYLQLKKWGEGSRAYGGPSQGGSVWAFLKTLVQQIREESGSKVINILVMDVFLQRRTFKADKLRWFMHICILYGWIGLAFFSMAVTTSYEMYGVFVANDHEMFPNAWIMLEPVFDFLSYMLLIGIAIAIGRRLFSKDTRAASDGTDWILISLLILVVASGFYAQYLRETTDITVRMLTSEYPAEYYGSFGNSFTIFHEVFSLFAMVAYIPYSKFMHIIASPLAILATGGGKK